MKKPHWDPSMQVCTTCVQDAKELRFKGLLNQTVATAPGLVEQLGASKPISLDLDADKPSMLSRAEHLAAEVAGTVGSWSFSSIILVFLLVWIGTNLFIQPVEPFPVLMLAVISAVLASVAAIQGPIILMSQRRQQNEDRERAKNDYLINLKAELEIQYLNEKIDHLALLLLEREVPRRDHPGQESSTSR
jgi:uncharacterized membrane protein